MDNDTREMQIRQEVLKSVEKDLEGELINLFPGKGESVGFLKSALSMILNRVMLKERQYHLEDNSGSVGNGFCPSRNLMMGTIPIDIEIPRTRGKFYPSILPKYQRNLEGPYEDLVYSVLLGAKSFKSVREILQHLGLSYSDGKVEEIVEELDRDGKEFNSRPLDADWLFIFIDAKVVEMKDEANRVKKGVHYIVSGVNLNAQKELLATKISFRNESIESWRELLLELKNRGVTRVLMIITDDFSGLTKLIGGLFPGSDHQLCTVHLQRNAYRHLSKEDWEYFQQKIKEIVSSSSFEVAMEKLQEIYEKLGKEYKGFMENIRNKAENFVSFAKYPHNLWGHIRTTNMSEGMNNVIETMKRNSGGYFHTERELSVKIRIMTIKLYRGKWRKPSPIMKSMLHELLQMFYERFEGQLPEEELRAVKR